MKNVTLVLSDGTQFHGKSFGYDAPVAGEVVFNTAMMGYPESLTDPSYAGQLMTLTYPLVGNYGVPPFTFEKNGLPTFMESDKIYASAIIVSDYSEQYSHWNAVESLAEKKSKTIPTRIRIAAAVNSPYIARKIASVPEITFIQVIRLGICFLITNILIISIDISVKT